MMKKQVAQTSIISYYNILTELSERQKNVLQGLKQLKIANNLMISKKINVTLQSVCGRMYELRHKPVPIVRLHHVGACPYTHETTKFYCLVDSFDKFIQ